MLVDASYLREKAHYCVALARNCPHLPTEQALEALGVDLMETAAELERDESLTASMSDKVQSPWADLTASRKSIDH